MSPRILSVNIARPADLPWLDGTVPTGIYKEPREGPAMARTNGLDGDFQSDLTVHGGPRKAVYVYPASHYDWWRGQLRNISLTWGAFGENLDVEGLDENNVHIGDRFRAGDAEFEVTTPRQPCFKLGLKFQEMGVQHMSMVKKFWLSERSGFYFAVVKEGKIQAGDELVLTYADPRKISIRDVFTDRVAAHAES